MNKESLREKFDKECPCIQQDCDNNGTYPTPSEDGCDPNPCRYCIEIRIPTFDFFWNEIQKREEELIQKIEIMKPHCLGLTDSCLVTKKQVLALIKQSHE